MRRSAVDRARILMPGHYASPAIVPAWGRDELQAAAGCFLRGRIVRGPHVVALASAIREQVGVRYVLPVNHARTAIEVALRAMGVGTDCDVVVPSYVCRSVPAAIARTGARAVFADVGPELHATPETIAAALTPATKCVVVPHLFGNTAPIDEIEAMLAGSGVALLDDAAQALGARRGGRPAGTFGRCGVTSCGPRKPLQGPAGGLVLTDDPDIYERAAAIPLPEETPRAAAGRLLAGWWWWRLARYTTPLRACLGRLRGPRVEVSYRACAMSNLDAAIALCQSRSLQVNAERRRANAGLLAPHVGAAGCIITDLSAGGMAGSLALLLHASGPSARETSEALSDIGLECLPGYSPCHLRLREGRPVLPMTEALWRRCICLPLDLPVRRPERVGQALRRLGLR